MQKLALVYGFIPENTLLIREFAHCLRGGNTVFFGIVIDQKNINEQLPISPFDLDESEYDVLYQKHIAQLIAEVQEDEGDTITSAKRHSWERILKTKKPSLFVCVLD